MKIIEIGTGYTSIPAQMGAATEIVVEELTRSMRKLGEDVTIVDIKDSHRAPNDLPIIEAYMPQFFSSTDTGLGIVHKMKRVLYSVSLTRTLHGLIRKYKDEELYLHFHNQYNLYFFLKLTPRKLRRRVKIGYTVHSHVWFGKWEDIKDVVSRRYFQEVACVKAADRVFVLNDVVAEMLRDHCGVSADRITRVINGVNTDIYSGKLDAGDEMLFDSLRKRGHDFFDKKIALQIGSVCPRKNQLGTLRLLLPAMRRHPELIFVYAGGIVDPGYQKEIQEFAASEGVADRVHYMGELRPGGPLNFLYSIATCAFMNSTSEAFALVIAEGMSARCPVFVNESILSSLPFLDSTEIKGLIKISESGFQKDIDRLLTDEEFRTATGNVGREYVASQLSWDVAARQYLSHM